MTTTNFSLCIFCLCLLTSCGKGEKKTNEPIRVKVAEAEMRFLLRNANFHLFPNHSKRLNSLFGWVDRLTVSKYMQVITIIGEIS